ncbi:MAG TPA: zinc-binding dehydrogenase [Candidatus Binatia bacterium]|nr:zinc-binding dehydrogenase [Candidatus Binatia bacterium]
MKFRAAVLVELKKPLVLEEIETAPLRFGQVLVKILCSGICGAQLNEIEGAKGPDKFLPHLLGHEATAEVVEVGEGVAAVKPGERVVCHWRKGAGLQAPPANYTSRAFPRINSGWVTTFSEYSIVSENRVTRVPADFDVETGALFGCAVTTAMGVINNNAKLGIGESIAVFGTGGVGLNIIQFAAKAGAHPIIGIDLHDHKLELARKLGATHTLNARNGDLREEIRKIAGMQGVDVAIENTGVAEVIETAYEVAGAQGRVILVGVPPKAARHPSFYTLPLHFNKVLTGSEGGGCRPEIDIPKLVRLCQAGKLDFPGLVSQRYRLDQINDAIADLKNGRAAGRCMVRMA